MATFVQENLTDLCFELYRRQFDDSYEEGGAIDSLSSLIAVAGTEDGLPACVEAVRLIRNAAVARIAKERFV